MRHQSILMGIQLINHLSSNTIQSLHKTSLCRLQIRYITVIQQFIPIYQPSLEHSS